MASIDRRLLWLSVLICGIACVLAFLMASYKVEQSARAVLADRVKLILAQVEKVAENNIALGITPEEMRTLASVLQRQVASDGSIAALDLYARTGRILHSSDDSRVGKTVHASALCTDGLRERFLTLSYASSIRVVRSVTNSFDVVEACLGADIDAKPLRAAAEQARWQLGMACVLAWLLGAAAMFWGLRRGVKAYFSQIEAACSPAQPQEHGQTGRWRDFLSPVLGSRTPGLTAP